MVLANERFEKSAMADVAVDAMTKEPHPLGQDEWHPPFFSVKSSSSWCYDQMDSALPSAKTTSQRRGFLCAQSSRTVMSEINKLFSMSLSGNTISCTSGIMCSTLLRICARMTEKPRTIRRTYVARSWMDAASKQRCTSDAALVHSKSIASICFTWCGWTCKWRHLSP